MTIQILLPTLSAGGNRATADRYAGILRELHHHVTLHDRLADDRPDLLIAIHARKCHEALVAFRTRHPDTPIVLVLAGTDIYPDPSAEAVASMRLADRLVTLQDHARRKIPPEDRARARTIIQSVEPMPAAIPPADDAHFDLCVVGNLRAVKDPLRAAAAARLLPPASTIRIRHAGRILDEKFVPLVEREVAENPRYQWLGPLPAPEARALIASSRLQVLSSIDEGGAQVLGESVVAGTPLLVSRHDAARSLLGDDYPGFFEIGATAELAGLMTRAETDPAFLSRLDECTRALVPRFAPQREREAWRDLLSGLISSPDAPKDSPEAASS